jgi:hypothetical protein
LGTLAEPRVVCLEALRSNMQVAGAQNHTQHDYRSTLLIWIGWEETGGEGAIDRRRIEKEGRRTVKWIIKRKMR